MGTNTPKLNLYKPGLGEVGWGDEVNANFDILDNFGTEHNSDGTHKSVDPSVVDDHSATVTEMQSTTDPYPAGSESLPTNLIGEIERLRYQLNQVIGRTNWYEDPNQNLENIKNILNEHNTSGVHKFPVKIVSTTYTALTTDTFILADTSSGGFTITLPALANVDTGKLYVIKNIGTNPSPSASSRLSSGGILTVQPNGTETIDGKSAYYVSPKNAFIGIVKRSSTDWAIVMNGGNMIVDNNPAADDNTHNDNLMCPIDLWWDAEHRRLHTRTVMCTEIGDTPELAFRRADGTYPDGSPTNVVAGTSLGLIHFTGWCTAGSFQGRSAQIYAKATETPSATASGGELYFATTQNGTNSPADAMRIDHEGTVEIIKNVNFSSIAKPNCAAVLSADQTISASTWTKLLFNTEEYDNGGIWDATNSKFVAQKDGLYAIRGHIEYTAVSDGVRLIVGVYKNGALLRQHKIHSGAAADIGIPFNFEIPCLSSDTLEIYVHHNDSVSRTVTSSSVATYVTVSRLK